MEGGARDTSILVSRAEQVKFRGSSNFDIEAESESSPGFGQIQDSTESASHH